MGIGESDVSKEYSLVRNALYNLTIGDKSGMAYFSVTSVHFAGGVEENSDDSLEEQSKRVSNTRACLDVLVGMGKSKKIIGVMGRNRCPMYRDNFSK